MANGKYRNQTALAQALNYTPARISQYLRLLDIPKSVQEEVLQGRVRPTERGLREILAEKPTLLYP